MSETYFIKQSNGTYLTGNLPNDFVELKVEEADETHFSIGQCYDERPAQTLQCSKCKGNQFYVGAGDYYTAIMCINCKTQACIHDG